MQRVECTPRLSCARGGGLPSKTEGWSIPHRFQRSSLYTREPYASWRRKLSLARANLRTPQSHPAISSLRQRKKRTRNGCVFIGAEKRIRTSGTFQAHTRFPIVLLKPLRHLCNFFGALSQSAYIYYFIFSKKSSVFTPFCKNILKSCSTLCFYPLLFIRWNFLNRPLPQIYIYENKSCVGINAYMVCPFEGMAIPHRFQRSSLCTREPFGGYAPFASLSRYDIQLDRYDKDVDERKKRKTVPWACGGGIPQGTVLFCYQNIVTFSALNP